MKCRHMVVFRKWNYLIFCIKVRSIRFATLHAFMCAISKFLKTYHYGRLPAIARNYEGGIS